MSAKKAQGKIDEAFVQFSEAIALKPEWARSIGAGRS